MGIRGLATISICRVIENGIFPCKIDPFRERWGAAGGGEAKVNGGKKDVSPQMDTD